MNKNQLTRSIAGRVGSSEEEVRAHLAAFEDVVTETLKRGEEVWLPGFGKFYVRERQPREGEVQVPAGKVVTFRAGKYLKVPD